MSDTIEVFKIGTKVVLHDQIEGTITSIGVHPGRVVYEVVWMAGYEKKAAAFYDFEFKPRPNYCMTRIGFKEHQ